MVYRVPIGLAVMGTMPMGTYETLRFHFANSAPYNSIGLGHRCQVGEMHWIFRNVEETDKDSIRTP